VGVPSPAIPSFTDGTIVHQADLNSLATNLTNLYSYNQGGFFTQRPCVIATQTSGQAVANATDTLVSFNSAPVNTNNMWVASQATQITIQTAGVYYCFGLIPYPTIASPTLSTVCTANLWVNGTSPSNAVNGTDIPFVAAGSGAAPQASYLGNFASGTVIYLDAYHTAGSSQTLRVSPYGAILAAIYLTPST
jgi:hypothetical protein